MAELDVDDLDLLMAKIKAAGAKQVSMDIAALNLPGVWVNVTGFTPNVLSGLTIKLELVALSGNSKDPRRALKDVQPALNAILAAISAHGGPSSDPVTGVWQQQGNAARMPGVSVPFDLVTCPEE